MKNKILPIIAGVLVVIAILVLILIFKGDNKTEIAEDSQEAMIQDDNNTESNETTENSNKLAKLDNEGNVIINKSDLSEDTASFFKYSEDSKIELVAIKDNDGEVKVSLGTCQSCNGTPKAYYTQEGELLKCNNCGKTFQLDVIGGDGTGCYPIKIDEDGITETDTGIKISKDVLLKNENLFEKVAEH